MATLEQSLAKLRGNQEEQAAMKSLLIGLTSRLSSRQAATAQEVDAVLAQLQGVGGYRATSPVDERGNAERTAGQMAVALAIKGNAALTVAEAIAKWNEAALAYRQSIGREHPIHDPVGCLEDYLLDLSALGKFAEPTWAAFRAWISATPLEQLGI